MPSRRLRRCQVDQFGVNLIKSASTAAKHALGLLGVVTRAANNHPVVMWNDKLGKMVTHTMRDSVEAPRRTGGRQTGRRAQVPKPPTLTSANLVTEKLRAQPNHAKFLNKAERRWQVQRKRIWASEAEMAMPSPPIAARMEGHQIAAVASTLTATACESARPIPLPGSQPQLDAADESALERVGIRCEVHQSQLQQPPSRLPRTSAVVFTPRSTTASILKLLG